MPSPFSNLFSSGFGSDRSSSRHTTHSGYGYEPSSRDHSRSEYGSSRLTEPFDMPYCEYTSTPRRETFDSSPLRREATQREPHDNRYNYRDLSPLRTSERPRAFTNRHAYDDHRSVSPLGASRFEQPSQTSRLFSSGDLSRSSFDREARDSYASSTRDISRDASRSTSFEIDRGYDGYERPSTSGGGLFRSSAVRGSTAPRRMGDDGEYGPHLGRERRPHIGSNFRNGGFNWEDF